MSHRGWAAFRRGLAVCGTVVLMIAVLVGLERIRHERKLAELHQRYQEECRRRAESAAQAVDRTLGRIREGVGTMARLPGVRSALARRTAPQGDALVTIQELYNALAADVAMSEVYLVPAGMDPDGADPVLREPLVTFDELILDARPAEGRSADPRAQALEETEIHEYRLMREQLRWLAGQPRSGDGLGLRLPVVTGRPVITCDNSRMDAARRDDGDRTGVVLSVPCHGADGAFLGCVSGVILNHALRELLVDGQQAILLPAGGILARGDAPDGRAAVGEVDLRFPDGTGTWRVRYAYGEAVRDAAPALVAARDQHRLVIAIAILGTLAAAAVALLLVRVAHRRSERRVGIVLDAMAAARGGDLTVAIPVAGDDATARVARALGEFLAALRTDLGRIAEGAAAVSSSAAELTRLGEGLRGEAGHSADQAGAAAAGSEQVSTSARNVSSGLEEMGASIREISTSTQQASSIAHQALQTVQRVAAEAQRLDEASIGIGVVVDAITAVAEQTNLLALNATIEAARAGTAGRGFAVVAGEVKSLAGQTAASTQDIGRRIAQMQEASRAVTGMISELQAVIHRIEQSQGTIAAAVEEQSATTAEGGRNMSEVAKGSHEIAGSVASVSAAARRTAEHAETLLAAARGLSSTAGSLAQAVAAYRR